MTRASLVLIEYEKGARFIATTSGKILGIVTQDVYFPDKRKPNKRRKKSNLAQSWKEYCKVVRKHPEQNAAFWKEQKKYFQEELAKV